MADAEQGRGQNALEYLELSDAALLGQCEVHTYRASGPGGQKRNKTDSAVRLNHKPTGIRIVGTESRSQHENKARALKRLRKALALRVRHEVSGDEIPESLAACIAAGRLDVGQRDRRYLGAAASALDLLVWARGSVGDAARHLGLTTGNLSAFLTDDDDLMTEANRIRSDFGLRPLRRD